jgi:xanthine dehydrogenase accessory factor
MRVLIKGAGDLATGVAQALWRAGMEVLMTEIAQPLAVRRGAALAQAVFDGATRVEDMQGHLVKDVPAALRAIGAGFIPVLVDKDLHSLVEFKPQVLAEATLAKKNSGLKCGLAPFTLALGPGFYAGLDADVVLETMRGPYLARLIYEGEALPNTGEPGPVAGYTSERLLRAHADGLFAHEHKIGDMVKTGEVVAYCGERPLKANIDGCLRGLLHKGIVVKTGMKVGDIDPLGKQELCFSVSDKARALGGSALTAIMQWQQSGRYM